MKRTSTRLPWLLRLIVALLLASGAMSATLPDSMRLPSASAKAAPMVLPHDSIDTNQYQSFTSASGLTTLYISRQVISGKAVAMQVQTLPNSYVTLILAFPDGTTIPLHRRTNAQGIVQVLHAIAYQPQSSAETATISVEVLHPRKPFLNEKLQGSFSVLQHVVLIGKIRTSAVSVGPGTPFYVTVTANYPGVLIRFLVTYPSGSAVPQCCGLTDATGNFTTAQPFLVPATENSGVIIVDAYLSYSGEQLHLSRRVALRSAKS